MEKNQFMQRAIELAGESIHSGGGPFGAVIVKDGKIVAEGFNRVTVHNDPTAHAEVQAIRSACKALNTFELKGCEIYTSCEPCPMCFSAIYWARLDAVYYAATHEDAEKIGFDDAFIYREIKQKIDSRSVPFIRLDDDTALVPFQKWVNLDHKTEY
jgi:guanine deaminase